MKNQYENSRPFDINLWSERPEVDAAVDAIFEECRTRGVRREHPRMKVCLKVVILNLYTCYASDPSRYIRCSRRHTSLISRYNFFDLSTEQIVTAVDRLKGLGYINFLPGYLRREGPKPKGRQSRMRATPNLIERIKAFHVSPLMVVKHHDSESILLKDNRKRLIDYEETPETTAWRAEMATINDIISKTLVNLYLSEADLQALRIRMIEGEQDENEETGDDLANPEEIEGDPLDFTKKSLVRVFNNSSFRQGGRLYGGWWQGIPRDYRRFIRINRMNTAEVDFGAMHLHLAYWLENVPVPDGDLYELEGFPKETRDVVKASLLTMFNTNEKKAIRSINERIRGYKYRTLNGVKKKIEFSKKKRIIVPPGVQIEDIIGAFRKKHEAIGSWFFSCRGRELQYWDSVIAVKTLLIMAKRGVPALPLHDSFIVSEPNERCARAAMTQAFHGLTGLAPKVDSKPTLTEDHEVQGREVMEAHYEWKMDPKGGYSEAFRREYRTYLESFEEWKRITGRNNMFIYSRLKLYNKEVYD